MTRACIALACLTWTLTDAVPVAAQTTETATRARLDTLLTAAPETPGGQGLLPTAIAEARAVMDRAVLAERSDDLAAIHQAAAEILAALDPSLAPPSSATGYGIRRALQAIAVEGTALVGDRAADAQRTGRVWRTRCATSWRGGTRWRRWRSRCGRRGT
jgi:hypothetical protein